VYDRFMKTAIKQARATKFDTRVWNNAAVDCYGDSTARTVIMPMRM